MTADRPRRTRHLAALTVLGLLWLSPANAQPADRDAEAVHDQVQATDRDLAAAKVRLDAAQRELARLDDLSAEVAGSLTEVQARLAVARAAAGAATLEAVQSMADLVEREDLTAERASAAVAEATLADRAIWMWKHGPTAVVALRAELFAGAQSTHDLAMSDRVVDRIVESSTDDAVAAERRLAQIIGARNVADRDRARTSAFEARGEADGIAVLERQHLALAADLRDLRDQQALIVANLARDRDALTVLATQLRRALAEISLAGALVPPADLPLDGPPPPWIDQLPPAGQQWAPAIEAIAIRHGVDGALFTALVWSESGFHAAAVSSAGAIGLAQLMPGTAAGLGVDPWNPYENLAGGARYLHAQIVRFGRADLGLAAYNAGPGRVADAGNQVPDILETQLYVVRVLERWDLLRSAG